MAKSSHKRDPRLKHSRPADVVTNVLGIEPGDPIRPHIWMHLIRAKSDGEDISDPHVIQRCAIAAHNSASQQAERIDVAERFNWIYYVQVGDLVKIGTTRDLRARLSSYPPGSKLLATERGSYLKEAERLKEFREYLAAHNEWFNPGERLTAHIQALAEGVSLANGVTSV